MRRTAGQRAIGHPASGSCGAGGLVAYCPDDALVVVVLATAEAVDLDRVEAAITDARQRAFSFAAPL